MDEKQLENINAICNYGRLEEFRIEITKIVENVVNKGFAVSFREDDFKSVAEWGNSRMIRLSLKDRTRGKKIIWDLLHEFGHVLDDEPPMGMTKLEEWQRELNAWNNARNELPQYPTLLPFKEGFEEHRKECLLSHKIYNKLDVEIS